MKTRVTVLFDHTQLADGIVDVARQETITKMPGTETGTDQAFERSCTVVPWGILDLSRKESASSLGHALAPVYLGSHECRGW